MPVRLRKYNEGQSATVSFNFRAADGSAALPSTARYRIDCLTNKREVRDWVTLTVAQSVDVAITPDDNAIINNRNPEERKQLVIETDYDTDAQQVATSEWTVKNLQGLT